MSIDAEESYFMSSFRDKKLDMQGILTDTICMEIFTYKAPSRRITITIRLRIQQGGERLWRFEDFYDLPFTAVAQALSRLARQGELDRLSKGIYYRARQTTFGKSQPNPAAIQKLASLRKKLFPAGLAAANLLGFSTQTGGRTEIATNARSLPRKLIGPSIVVHTRRPEAWAKLTELDAALLDFLRQGAKASELSPEQTIAKLLAILSEDGRYDRLLDAAASEPPRVRAILGAIGEQLGKDPVKLQPLRNSLNPLSRFEFGMLNKLLYANRWLAKERRQSAIV